MRSSIMKWMFLLLGLFMNMGIYAQTRPFEGTYNEDDIENEPRINPDSINYEAYTEKSSSFKALFNGKPGKAIMYGLMIPGGGQLYNRKYWKFPIALAAEGTAGYIFYLNRSRYLQFRNAYAMRLEDPEYPFLNLSTAQINTFRKSYQKQSEQAGIAVIATHILVAVEAYINRPLIDFDISEDLSIQLKPQLLPLTGSGMMALTFSYQLN